MARQIVIKIDSRERYPLPIPQRILNWRDPSRMDSSRGVTVHIKTRTTRLKTADYLLATGGGCCYDRGRAGIIETKRSIAEVAANVLTTDGRRKFRRVLSSMADNYTYPLLIFEGSPSTLYKPSSYCPDPRPKLAIDALFAMLLEHHVHFILIPGKRPSQRRLTADLAVRFLLAGGVVQWQPK